MSVRSEPTALPPIALTLLALALAGLIGCGTDVGARREAEEERADRPRRVISLIPAATETIIALGAGERLVARTEYDTDPMLADLPSVGGGLTPSLEHLSALEPDLVITWPDNVSRALGARLRDLQVDVYAPEIQTLEDIWKLTRELGDRLGLQRSADSLVATIQGELDRVREAPARMPRPAVFYVVWHDPPTTASAGTYVHQLIEIAGGRNIFADAPGLWPQVSIEEIVRRRPDYVVLPTDRDAGLTPERLRAAAGWRELDALHRGHLVEVDAGLFNRPGPYVARAARRLAKLLHPGLQLGHEAKERR